MDLAESVIHLARETDLGGLNARKVPDLVHLWPGEHYRLLAAITRCLKAKTIVEIGTFTGLSALAMLSTMPQDGELVTFDILPWDKVVGAFFVQSDFENARLTQIVADLADVEVMKKHAQLFSRADVIFIDGPKDGTFESRLLCNLNQAGIRRGALLVLDDIRQWNMLAIWRRILQPKLDITSFGHWSGTGLVEWI